MMHPIVAELNKLTAKRLRLVDRWSAMGKEIQETDRQIRSLAGQLTHLPTTVQQEDVVTV